MLIKVEEEVTWLGRILIRKLPDGITEHEFVKLWRALSERERDRYTVDESHNLITTAGRTQVLTFIGAAGTGTAAFSQFVAIGNFPINKVFPGDASVQGEFFRSAPSLTTVTGNTVDISTFVGASLGNGVNYTNCGIFGVNAVSGVGGAGTLMTHATMNGFSKANPATVVLDYLVSLS